MTLGTPKLTKKQTDILKHLHLRGHAMTNSMLCAELGYRFIGVDTWNKLRDHAYVRVTDQGWLITDSGKIRAEDGV